MKDPRYQDLPDAVVESEYADLSFIGQAGFRYFLPAYMSGVLSHRDSGTDVVQAMIFALTTVEGALRTFMLSKNALFKRAQRAAVASFLEAMIRF